MGGLVRQNLAARHLCGLLGPFGQRRPPAGEAFLCQFRFVGLGKGYGHHQAVKAVQDGVHGGSPSCGYVVEQFKGSVAVVCFIKQQACHARILLFSIVISSSYLDSRCTGGMFQFCNVGFS